MGSKPRPFPYRAAGLIDDATMAATSARRTIAPLLDKPDLETVARTGKVMDLINQVILKLSQARSMRPEENEDRAG